MRNRILVLELVVGLAMATAGCASARRAPRCSGSASDSVEPLAPRPTAAVPAPMRAPAAPTVACGQPPPPPACNPCCPPCGLPCERCEGGWHARILGGRSFWRGTDAGDNCDYLGADVGRTLCGSCWSVDGFWRSHTAHFPRDPAGEDGGTWNHVGLKASYERSIGGGRWFVWGGAGPEYFWTSDYLKNDSGVGVFAEAGIGYVVNRNVRVRAGVNVDAMNTDAGRRSPAGDTDSRWLWVVSPVVGLEFDF